MTKTKYILLLFVLLLIAFVTPLDKNTMIIPHDNGVVTGVSLPMWGETCKYAIVNGSPRGDVLTDYIIPPHTEVRIYDQSRPTGEWVMIDTAEWIRLEDLCR